MQIMINGTIDLHGRQLSFADVTPLIVGENRTTLLKIEVPVELAEYSFHLTIADNKGASTISPKLDVEILEEKHYISYTILNDVLKANGRLLLQITALYEVDGIVATYKTLVNQQLSVSTALTADKQTEELPNIIAEAQKAIDNANNVAGQILDDKASGVFDGKGGEKGDKGDPSSLDKLGINATVIDLSDIEIGTYGTLDNPIEITENTTIVFQGFTPVVGYQKAFELCIKRTGGFAVIWQDIKAWAYGEIPLLPVGKRQEIKVRTTNGINYYGAGGDVYNVQELESE